MRYNHSFLAGVDVEDVEKRLLEQDKKGWEHYSAAMEFGVYTLFFRKKKFTRRLPKKKVNKK